MNECVDSLVAIYDYSEEVDDDDVDDYMAKTIPVFIMVTGRRNPSHKLIEFAYNIKAKKG